VHGHKGGLGLEVCVHGHAAHSSQPELGVNAITAAARIIAAVDAENERLAVLPTTTAVGPGTISVTEISGGTARNIIPDSCRLYIGRRLSPGEDPAVVQAELTATVTRAAGPATVDVVLANGVAFPAFFTDSDNAFIGVLADITGEQPATVTYGSNCLAYDGIDVTKVVFGPGSIDQAHQAVEWVEISELVRAREVYATLLTM
jgi:acetylornithine deacetylase